MAIMFPVASRLCMHACVRVKNDNHITSSWAGRKGSTVLGFSVVTEPVVPAAELSLNYTQRTQRPGNMTTHSVLNVNQNPANL